MRLGFRIEFMSLLKEVCSRFEQTHSGSKPQHHPTLIYKVYDRVFAGTDNGV